MASPAWAFELAPFKDHLFAYPGIIDSRDGGDRLVVDYREMRDINGRDQVPERRVKRHYVDFAPRRQENPNSIDTPHGEISFVSVGRATGARLVTFYIHGRGGDQKQGVNDYTFGGNFNRIKNLMVRNSSLYVSPDAGALDEAAVERVRYLIAAVLRQAGEARLVLACASAGGAVCHALADDASLVGRMEGIAFLGSYGLDSYFDSAAYRREVPLFLAHGSADSVISFEGIAAFYERVQKTPGYPVRLVRFETGGHGTPIRMTDWRDMINWMLRAG
ncbi:alpha/beta hydrolase [Oricola cellulosilytica]|uniref:Alpha/beta hydrolase n=1 Tax=Oricola cellulosilytica TaxID=1429082 RepID=A0A4R0PBB9_9HYPH|nr:alpha/beta hydrolase [Oricola cellulosilytica]TCD14561.1 alpha/beta hydrolase [Oricola cellulosilytica]